VWRNDGAGLPLTQVNLQRALAQIPAGSMVQPTHFTGVSDPSLLPGSAPGDIDMPGPATPCVLTTLVPSRKARRKTTCVLLPTGRAPLDVVLEVLTMSGIVGAHLAAELEVPPVALSRLRHDSISDDGTCRRNGGDNDMLIWGLAGVAAAGPPINGLFNDRPKVRQAALWYHMTGVNWQEWELQPGDGSQVASALAEYLTTYKPPLVLVRFLSGLATGDYARSLGLSRQRLNLIQDRDPATDALTRGYLRTAVTTHLQHLTSDSFWGAHGCRLLPTETP
jgi:hypothetical protein